MLAAVDMMFISNFKLRFNEINHFNYSHVIKKLYPGFPQIFLIIFHEKSFNIKGYKPYKHINTP